MLRDLFVCRFSKMLYEKLREQSEEFTARSVCVCECRCLCVCVYVSLVRRFVLLLSCPVFRRGGERYALAVFMASAET